MPLPALPEGMSAAAGQKVINFTTVKARIGATHRTITFDFYRNENSTAPDFKVSLYFKWPVKSRCDVDDLEKYDIIFQANPVDSFILRGGMKNVVLSRYGMPLPGETLGLVCTPNGNKLNIKGFFKGESYSQAHDTTYQWNIASDSEIDLSQ